MKNLQNKEGGKAHRQKGELSCWKNASYKIPHTNGGAKCPTAVEEKEGGRRHQRRSYERNERSEESLPSPPKRDHAGNRPEGEGDGPGRPRWSISGETSK